MPTRRVVIIGAGIGGLVSALLLSARGFAVDVIESAHAPGGKMREIDLGGARVDAGPTVFTMRWVFETILAEAGLSLSDALTLHPLETLARHAWSETERLDLFTDVERSADAIAAFAGRREAEGYRRFQRRARAIHDALKMSFMAAPRPNPLSLTLRMGPTGLWDLMKVSPFETLWSALGDHFQDPRLRQLFGRYATYCGSSPFQAPATLMLISEAERQGVWRVEGGIHRIAAMLTERAEANGARFHFGRVARRILSASGRAAGVEIEDGERIAADAVVMNGDVAALEAGLLEDGARREAPREARRRASLSAYTLAMSARCEGLDLLHHNVFFDEHYHDEFDDVFARRRLPSRPSVYVCAQDRADGAPAKTGERERLFLIVNAPAVDADNPISPEELTTCQDTIFRRLARCGLTIHRESARIEPTSPMDFARMFPATGGALYGPATHGWRASFTRPGARSRLPGLYLAGGGVHPGPGMPMAALSGLQAARALMRDLTSARPSLQAAMLGGISTL